MMSVATIAADSSCQLVDTSVWRPKIRLVMVMMLLMLQLSSSVNGAFWVSSISGLRQDCRQRPIPSLPRRLVEGSAFAARGTSLACSTRKSGSMLVTRGGGSVAHGNHDSLLSTSKFALQAQRDGSVSDPQQEEESSWGSTWLGALVFPLWLVYVSNIWSRSSLYYLVNFDAAEAASTTSVDTASRTAMNVALQFDQAQYGILASLAFTTLFAVASLGAGYAADRFNRKTLTLVSVVGWTVATFGTAQADSYNQVLLWRIAMGLACAFSTPTAYTWIRDVVPKTRQATASSVYGTGVALGSGLASLTLLLDTTVGWREALTIIAMAGLGATLVAAVVLPNDEKVNTIEVVSSSGSSSELIPDNNSLVQDVTESLATRRAQWIYAASLLRFSAGLCIGVWGAPYFRMAFADRTADYAVIQAGISAVGATASGVLGGALADRLSSSSSSSSSSSGTLTSDGSPSDAGAPVDLVGRRLWVPVVGSVLAVPTWYLCLHSTQSFEASMAWLAAEYFVAECWFGPTISTLQATVGPRIGGTAQGLFTLSGAFANLSPTLLGFLYSQAVSSSSTSASSLTASSSSSTELCNLLTGAVCFGYLTSAVGFAMAALASPTALKKEKA